MGSKEFKKREWIAKSRNFSPDGIHDDERARRLGFDGGFVPGVVLYEHIAADNPEPKTIEGGLFWIEPLRVRMLSTIKNIEIAVVALDTGGLHLPELSWGRSLQLGCLGGG